MSIKENITLLLMGQFSSVYCDSCIYNGDGAYPCDECSRRSMNWRLSPDKAENVSVEILKIVGEK